MQIKESILLRNLIIASKVFDIIRQCSEFKNHTIDICR